MSHHFKIAAFMVILVFCTKGIAQDQTEPDSLFKEGRKLFAQSVQDKNQIKPAIDLFEKIIRDKGNLRHRALAYQGALYTIKAKHTFFPFNKLKWAKEGLSILDEALSQTPEDIEVLFVHGTICHNLPGLFKRQNDAQRDFHKIIELLPDNMHRYDERLIADILDYLDNEIRLNKKEQKVVNNLNSNLSIASGEIE